ncbi:MAG: hypothetical protein KI786_13415 [Mameliella sp.]|nr:hypothetical protein [Phaeodactylibacter sp.]NRA51397.1 hypothetical protein [Phaeodactylibacter sp.]
MKKSGLLLGLITGIISHTMVYGQLPGLYSSTGFEYGKANALDIDGNYINAAIFQNTISVTATDSLTAMGLGTYIALTKYDADGMLIWANSPGRYLCSASYLT